MIELLIGAGVIALGVVAVRALRQAQQPDEEPTTASQEPEARASGAPRSSGAPTEPDRSAARGGPRGLRVDDVLLYADGELWLAGEVHLDEEGFALSLFSAPGGRFEWVCQLDAEAKEVAFLSATDEVPGGAVPTELPIAGMRLSLRRRGQADVSSHGEHLPLTTERADYAILGGPGGRTLVVVDFEAGDRLALHGERVGREMYDLLPGGDDA